MNPELKLLELMPVGRENARTGRELAHELIRVGAIPSDAKDAPRIVRELTHQLRAVGVPICADSADGFYLPANKEELREYLKRYAHRLAEIAHPYRAIKTTYLHWQQTDNGQLNAEADQPYFANIPEPHRKFLLQRYANLHPQLQVETHEQHAAPIQHASLQPNIPQLIQHILPTIHVNPHTTIEEAASRVQMKLIEILRDKPFRIFTALAWLNREGWNKGTIALHIKDYIEQRQRALKQSQSLFGGEP